MLSYFLGLDIKHTPNSLFLNQSKYLHDLLEQFGMTSAKRCPTPLVTKPVLSKFDGSSLPDGTQYYQVVGALQYATLTCPDISFAVNRLC
jgi:hypothetical protein